MTRPIDLIIINIIIAWRSPSPRRFVTTRMEQKLLLLNFHKLYFCKYNSKMYFPQSSETELSSFNVGYGMVYIRKWRSRKKKEENYSWSFTIKITYELSLLFIFPSVTLAFLFLSQKQQQKNFLLFHALPRRLSLSFATIQVFGVFFEFAEIYTACRSHRTNWRGQSEREGWGSFLAPP